MDVALVDGHVDVNTGVVEVETRKEKGDVVVVDDLIKNNARVNVDVALDDLVDDDVRVNVDVALDDLVDDDVRVDVMLEVHVNDDVDDAVNGDLLNYIVRVDVPVNVGEDDGDDVLLCVVRSQCM